MSDLLKYNGFDFTNPLFEYLGSYGKEDVLRCGKKALAKIDLDLDPREIEASGYGKIEADADPESHTDY
jgi:hypothetical protein